MTPRDPKDRLIVALDVATLADAERLLDRLQGQVTRFKIGSQLFTAAGPAAVESVHKRGAEVFLDLSSTTFPIRWRAPPGRPPAWGCSCSTSTPPGAAP